MARFTALVITGSRSTRPLGPMGSGARPSREGYVMRGSDLSGELSGHRQVVKRVRAQTAVGSPARSTRPAMLRCAPPYPGEETERRRGERGGSV